MFTDEQRQWLVMVRDHVADKLGIETDYMQDALVSRETGMSGATDFDYAPFSQQGGLGKVHQIFADELNMITEELNKALAA